VRDNGRVRIVSQVESKRKGGYWYDHEDPVFGKINDDDRHRYGTQDRSEPKTDFRSKGNTVSPFRIPYRNPLQYTTDRRSDPALTSPSHLALQLGNFPLSRVLPQAPQEFPQRFPGDSGRPALVEQGEGFLVFYCVFGFGGWKGCCQQGLPFPILHPPSFVLIEKRDRTRRAANSPDESAYNPTRHHQDQKKNSPRRTVNR
jgi:hypothetical protein